MKLYGAVMFSKSFVELAFGLPSVLFFFCLFSFFGIFFTVNKVN